MVQLIGHSPAPIVNSCIIICLSPIIIIICLSINTSDTIIIITIHINFVNVIQRI